MSSEFTNKMSIQNSKLGRVWTLLMSKYRLSKSKTGYLYQEIKTDDFFDYLFFKPFLESPRIGGF